MVLARLTIGQPLMPDQYGRLTNEDHEKVKRWWEMHWRGPVVCPVCKNTSWSTGEWVTQQERHAIDANAPGTVAFQYIMVMCVTCGHTMFFNAVKIGVTEHHQPPAKTLPAITD